MTIFVGDLLNFCSTEQFRFIYCDAAHDLTEIKRNLPSLIPLIDRQNCIFVCDDIKNPAMCEAVLALLQPDAHRLYGDFFVARFGAAVDA